MTLTPWLLALPLVALAAIPAWRAARMRRRRAFIEAYRFAPHLRAQVLQTWPNLHPGALNDVERGLRQFFRVSLAARGRMVAMPSKVIDELWHALILDTARYQFFCRHAFGRVLHHTPAAAMRAQARGAEPLRVATAAVMAVDAAAEATERLAAADPTSVSSACRSEKAPGASAPTPGAL